MRHDISLAPYRALPSRCGDDSTLSLHRLEKGPWRGCHCLRIFVVGDTGPMGSVRKATFLWSAERKTRIATLLQAG